MLPAYLIFLEWLALSCGPSLDYKQLDHPRWEVRNRFERAMLAGWPYTDGTLRAAEKSQSVHVADRARSIRQACRLGSIVRLGVPPWADWPLWDLQGKRWDTSRFETLRRAITFRVSELPPMYGAEPYGNYSSLTHLWAMDAINNNVPPSLIRLWFQVGRACDEDYKNHQRRSVMPIGPDVP